MTIEEIDEILHKSVEFLIQAEYTKASDNLLHIIEVLSPIPANKAELQSDDLLLRLSQATRLYADSLQHLGILQLALIEAEKALAIAIGLNNQIEQAKCHEKIGTINAIQGNYALALECMFVSLEIYQTFELRKFLAIILGNIGNVYYFMGNFAESIVYQKRALHSYESLHDYLGIIRTLHNIGNLFADLGDNENAFSFYQNSLNLAEKHGYRQHEATALESLGLACKSVKRTAESFVYLSKSLDIFLQLEMLYDVHRVKLHIAPFYVSNKQSIFALKILEEVYLFALEINNHRLIIGALINLAKLRSTISSDVFCLESGKEYAFKAITLCQELNSKRDELEAQKIFGDILRSENKLEQYVQHFERYHELYKEVHNLEVKKQADRFGWERKIADMEKQREIEQIQHNAELKLLEQRVTYQQREVENTIHELVNKNSFLHEVRKDVRAMSKYTSGVGNDIADKLLDRLERNIVPLESKKELENQWAEIHADFMNLLKLKYPDLTSMECKIAALLRMKLTSSNISAILFLSKRTVEFHRLNIRKKMGLNKDDEIHLVLNNFDNKKG